MPRGCRHHLGRRAPVRVPPEPEEVHPGHQDGTRMCSHRRSPDCSRSWLCCAPEVADAPRCAPRRSLLASRSRRTEPTSSPTSRRRESFASHASPLAIDYTSTDLCGGRCVWLRMRVLVLCFVGPGGLVRTNGCASNLLQHCLSWHVASGSLTVQMEPLETESRSCCAISMYPLLTVNASLWYSLAWAAPAARQRARGHLSSPICRFSSNVRSRSHSPAAHVRG
eukprot:COSAG02_NODE_1829_length_10738_cov_4.595827_15_plen_224_part_00